MIYYTICLKVDYKIKNWTSLCLHSTGVFKLRIISINSYKIFYFSNSVFESPK